MDTVTTDADQLLAVAEAALERGDTDAARELVAQARRKMTWRIAVRLGRRAAAVELATGAAT